jgi:hypothetical protein
MRVLFAGLALLAPARAQLWAPAAAAPVASGGAIAAGGAPEYVCRSAQLYLPGRSLGGGAPCLVAANGSEVAVAAELLAGETRFGWGAAATPGGAPVLGGVYTDRARYVCRARVSAGTDGGWHAGFTDLRFYAAIGGQACAFTFNGAVFAATGDAMQVLVAMPAGVDVTTVGLAPAAGAAPSATPSATSGLTPSATPTPTPSRSPTASATPIPAHVALWQSPEALGELSNAMVAGREGAAMLYVCAGALVTGEIVPGKFEVGWGGCDIPLNEREISDPVYTMLRATAWLGWAAAVAVSPAAVPATLNNISNVDWAPPAPGWAPVAIGFTPSDRGGAPLPRRVCRAWHPFAWTGPHAGYTDGVTRGVGFGSDATRPACLFSYGGLVVHATSFDVLFLGPPTLPSAAAAANASAAFSVVPQPGYSSSATPSNSRTPSGTPSRSPSASPTPSATPSPLDAATVQWGSVTLADVLGAPSRYVAAAPASAPRGFAALCRGYAAGGAALLASALPAAGAGAGACAGAATGAQALWATPWLAWSPPAAAVAVGAAPVTADGAAGGAGVCRAFDPATRAGPLAGALAGGACVLTATGASSAPGQAFDVLSLLPRAFTPADAAAWAAAQPALVQPSPSPSGTPSVSPSTSVLPSASLAPAVPGAAQWVRLAGLAGFPAAVPAGTETGYSITPYSAQADIIYVCR